MVCEYGGDERFHEEKGAGLWVHAGIQACRHTCMQAYREAQGDRRAMPRQGTNQVVVGHVHRLSPRAFRSRRPRASRNTFHPRIPILPPTSLCRPARIVRVRVHVLGHPPPFVRSRCPWCPWCPRCPRCRKGRSVILLGRSAQIKGRRRRRPRSTTVPRRSGVVVHIGGLPFAPTARTFPLRRRAHPRW